ncbi:MAG: hypothetical protein NVSMB47_16310 [Polyangiales bacterium]
MSERAFFEREAKKQATAAIVAIEAQTSAEVVVTLRHVSGSYRHADYLLGFLLALVTLIALLFLPQSFALIAFPVDVAFAFVAGALLSAYVPPLRRLLTARKLRDAHVRHAARASFVDLGVHRCTGRWGILVYVAMFEQRVEVVGDLAIRPKEIDGFEAAVAGMETAVARADYPAFLEAFRGLGPGLGKAFPHRDDDVNELPDDVDDGAGSA